MKMFIGKVGIESSDRSSGRKCSANFLRALEPLAHCILCHLVDFSPENATATLQFGGEDSLCAVMTALPFSTQRF